MAKVTGILLQGINYHWDGKGILVDDGIGVPWPLDGSLLEQIELFDGEGEPVAIFSIDFLAQYWSLVGESQPESIILLDDNGYQLPLYQQVEDKAESQPLVNLSSPPTELMLLAQAAPQEIATLADILNDADRLLDDSAATAIGTASFNSESIDDVLGWLAVYSHHD